MRKAKINRNKETEENNSENGEKTAKSDKLWIPLNRHKML